MAKKRKRAQSVNWVLGGLRKLIYDEKISGKDRLEALKLVMQIDEILPTSGVPADSPIATTPVDATKVVTPLVDNLLTQLREEKNAAT